MVNHFPIVVFLRKIFRMKRIVVKIAYPKDTLQYLIACR